MNDQPIRAKKGTSVKTTEERDGNYRKTTIEGLGEDGTPFKVMTVDKIEWFD
jgi:hypothetical protein